MSPLSLGVAAFLAGALMSGPCLADTIGDEEANVPVRQRARPYLAPSGLYYDNIFFYPRITAGAEYDSNIFASPTDPLDDLAVVLAPELRVLSDRDTVQHKLEFGARHYDYQRFGSENRTEAYARLQSARQVRSDLTADTLFEAARRFEDRGDSLTLTDSVTPIAYSDLRAETTLTKNFNRLGLALGGAIRDLSFEDGDSPSGASLDQSFRNGTIITASLKPFYDFSPGYRAFTRFQMNRRDYKGTDTIDQDSEGYDARAGLEFLLTPILFGSIEAGYLDQSYSDPLIPNANGLSTSAQLTWLMTPLMTVSLFGSRSIAEIAAQEQEARIDLSAGLRLDYELRRNLIASVYGVYRDEDFAGTARHDGVFKVGTEIDYSINRFLHFGIDYFYLERNSDVSDFSFNRHSVTVNVSVQY